MNAALGKITSQKPNTKDKALQKLDFLDPLQKVCNYKYKNIQQTPLRLTSISNEKVGLHDSASPKINWI